ncbi:ComGF family competence protein [Salibacterium aidingense]|uniref:ComGF family competence protein n=1 Tax=Salibacterium aidingense TaxID=384933 RepID=UPI0003FE22F0|nr:ComGF family competence protein [Salibacterium aidingense]
MTLLEVLISLTILFVCAVVLANYIPILDTGTKTSRQEIQLFFQQMKEDMDYAYDVEVTKNSVTFQEQVDKRQYLQSGSNIVRRKNGTGHEIVLQEIRGFSAAAVPYGAVVSIVDTNGVTWSGVVGRRPALEGENSFWVKREP